MKKISKLYKFQFWFIEKGGRDLVSKSQILAYFELVLKDFISTGRVKFYSLCEYTGDNKFKSLVENGLEYEVAVRKKTVDSTYMDVQVPSITKPKYEVAEGINLVPVNGLTDVRSPREKYVVIGKYTHPCLMSIRNMFAHYILN